DSTTTPTAVPPVSPVTGTTTRSRSSAGVSTTVRPRSAAARVAPGTPRSGPPVPATTRPAASYTWTCSPMRRASASVRVRVPPGGLSSRSSATPASVSAVSVVSCRNELRSCPAVISPSGTTVVTSSAPIRASMVRTIRRAIKAYPGPCLDLAEPEAPAVGRLDQPRHVELAAQRRHVHVQHFGRAVPVRVPGTLQDLLPRHHPARVAGQAFQDVEFLRGERHLPAQHGPHPGQQLGQAERLDQVIVRAGVQGQDTFRFLAAGGHHDDGHPRPLAQPPADVHPVAVRQAEIQQHHVRVGGTQRLPGGHHVINAVPAPAQAAYQLGGQARVILHHQDARAPASGRPHARRTARRAHSTTVEARAGCLVTQPGPGRSSAVPTPARLSAPARQQWAWSWAYGCRPPAPPSAPPPRRGPPRWPAPGRSGHRPAGAAARPSGRWCPPRTRAGRPCCRSVRAGRRW